MFDAVIGGMLDFIEHAADASAFGAWLKLRGIDNATDVAALARTYEDLSRLSAAGRNHIWGYVARNLSRPIWLSSEAQRADVVIGNPPWLSYRYMAPETQVRFRGESQRLGVWVGGRGHVSHQDLSGYFFARSVELYLKDGGTIAFVMPHAAITRQHFEGFRSGVFGTPRTPPVATVAFDEVWGFDERVQPLFPVPSAVILARQCAPARLPQAVIAFAGILPRRDASPAEADLALAIRSDTHATLAHPTESAYRGRFRQGAIVVPRMLFVAERSDIGRLGGDPAAPHIRSRRSRLEKAPWRDLPALEGRVEAEFLRPLYLGESVAPYRVVDPPLAIIPWDEHQGRLLDRDGARAAGYLHLASWLAEVEDLWALHGKRQEQITPRLDYLHQLSAQMPLAPVRVVYAASGTQPAAAVLRGGVGVVEHKLYWAAVAEDEARFLAAILNSETARSRVAHLQSRGQWGARDFDKVVFELPIPEYDPLSVLHAELAAAAQLAEDVAATVVLPPTMHFVGARSLIREALVAQGIAQKIEALVGTLLAGGA